MQVNMIMLYDSSLSLQACLLPVPGGTLDSRPDNQLKKNKKQKQNRNAVNIHLAENMNGIPTVSHAHEIDVGFWSSGRVQQSSLCFYSYKQSVIWLEMWSLTPCELYLPSVALYTVCVCMQHVEHVSTSGYPRCVSFQQLLRKNIILWNTQYMTYCITLWTQPLNKIPQDQTRNKNWPWYPNKHPSVVGAETRSRTTLSSI